MSSLIKRINRRLKETANTYAADLSFSRQLANYRLLDELCWRFHFNNVSAVYHEKKDQWILKYLKDKLSGVIEKYKDDTSLGIKEQNTPIWICWWSGEEDAPALVKQCIRSIRKNAGRHTVNMITEKNYMDYLEVPIYILDKVESGAMCIANFTDYLRVSLLEKYGGLWLDATIFCADSVPEAYFETSFFTCKSQSVQSRYLSKFRWTGFCLGGWKQHVFFRFLKEAFECYWSSEESSIDYLLMDYLFETAYCYLPIVRQCIDEVEPNNLNRDDLQAAMNMALPAEQWDEVINKETTLYKLSWRETYSLQTENGVKSIYNYYLSMNISGNKHDR